MPNDLFTVGERALMAGGHAPLMFEDVEQNLSAETTEAAQISGRAHARMLRTSRFIFLFPAFEGDMMTGKYFAPLGKHRCGELGNGAGPQSREERAGWLLLVTDCGSVGPGAPSANPLDPFSG